VNAGRASRESSRLGDGDEGFELPDFHAASISLILIVLIKSFSFHYMARAVTISL
jgi:hypothetical protein